MSRTKLERELTSSAEREKSLVDREKALQTELASFRLQVTTLTTELEVTKASHGSAAMTASSSAAQVAALSRKLGDANEEVCGGWFISCALIVLAFSRKHVACTSWFE